MSKPDLPLISPLSPLFIQEYERYLPTAFDESLTLLQKVNMIIKRMNEIGEITNELIDKWNEIYEWILNDGLEEAVETILQKWWDEGKFSEFFEGIIDELMMIRNSSFIGNIDFKKVHYRVGDNHTSVWLTNIPYLNEDGTRNILKRGFAKDLPNGASVETAREFSDRHKATAVINASTFNVVSNILDGAQVTNGVSLQADNNAYAWKWYMGIDANGLIKSFAHGTDNGSMVGQGMKEVLTAFFPIIISGQKADRSIWEAQGQSPFDPYERHVIAQRTNKDYVVMTSSGGLRKDFECGLTVDDIYSLLTSYYTDIDNAYMLDGGGSAQTVVYGTMLNRPADGSETTERPVPDFLYFDRDMLTPRDTDIYNAYKTIGYVRKELANLESAQYYNHEHHSGYVSLLGKTGFNGWGIEVWDEVERLSKLYIKQDDIQMFDIKGNQEIFRANASGLAIMGKRLGDFKESCTSLATLNDNLTISGNYYFNASAMGNPFTSSGGIAEVRRVDTTTTIVKVYPITGANVPKYRIYTGGSWGSWIDL